MSHLPSSHEALLTIAENIGISEEEREENEQTDRAKRLNRERINENLTLKDTVDDQSRKIQLLASAGTSFNGPKRGEVQGKPEFKVYQRPGEANIFPG